MPPYQDFDNFTLRELKAVAKYLGLHFHPKISRASILALIALHEISHHVYGYQECEEESDHEKVKICEDC